jgi:hypothetical protein
LMSRLIIVDCSVVGGSVALDRRESPTFQKSRGCAQDVPGP